MSVSAAPGAVWCGVVRCVPVRCGAVAVRRCNLALPRGANCTDGTRGQRELRMAETELENSSGTEDSPRDGSAKPVLRVARWTERSFCEKINLADDSAHEGVWARSMGCGRG